MYFFICHCLQMAHVTSPKLEEVNKMDAMDIPLKSFKLQQLKTHSNVASSKLNCQMLVNNDVFYPVGQYN